MAVETSIVIRTLNEAKYLENLMRGIHNQNYRDWEIVLVDSGSTDGTLEIAERYDARIFHMPKDEFTFGRSLNIGCRKAKGQYLVFVSGHVWPMTNNWLGNLIKPFVDPSVAMVYGRQRGNETNSISESRDLQSQFGVVSHISVDEPNGHNGNAAIRTALWKDQPFDESLPGLEDVDWARKIERKSHHVYYTAEAAVYHVHQETLKQVYVRFHREAIATKRMFPHNRFSRFDVVKGLPLFILRDILYGVRHEKIRKILNVPTVRVAQFLGIYRGLRHHQRLAAEATQSLEIPKDYRALTVDQDKLQPELHFIQTPELAADQVLVRVAFTSVSDFDQDHSNADSSLPGSMRSTGPLVSGHEFSGVVLQTGKGSKSLKRGQKVAGRTTAYAECVVAEEAQLQRLPQDMPLKYGVFAGPVAACAEALRRLEVGPGRNACVIGAGPQGNLCAQVLKAKGLHVTVVDANTRWLDLLAGRDVDTLEQPQSLVGYDYIVVSNGDIDAVSSLLSDAKNSGKIFFLGGLSSNSIEVISQNRDSAIVKSGVVKQHDWEESIRTLLSGDLHLEDHASTVEPLEAYAEVWADMKENKHFKVLLVVDPELEHV